MKAIFKITFNVAPPPMEAPDSIDLGTVGVALPEGDVIPVKGGTGPYTVTDVKGTVPPGVTINSDCSITGTPVAAGKYELEIAVSDSNETPA